MTIEQAREQATKTAVRTGNAVYVVLDSHSEDQEGPYEWGSELSVKMLFKGEKIVGRADANGLFWFYAIPQTV